MNGKSSNRSRDIILSLARAIYLEQWKSRCDRKKHLKRIKKLESELQLQPSMASGNAEPPVEMQQEPTDAGNADPPAEMQHEPTDSNTESNMNKHDSPAALFDPSLQSAEMAFDPPSATSESTPAAQQHDDLLSDDPTEESDEGSAQKEPTSTDTAKIHSSALPKNVTWNPQTSRFAVRMPFDLNSAGFHRMVLCSNYLSAEHAWTELQHYINGFKQIGLIDPNYPCIFEMNASVPKHIMADIMQKKGKVLQKRDELKAK